MDKFAFALGILAVVAVSAPAQADSSGHISINSLNAQLPRSYDAFAPVSDGYYSPAIDPRTCNRGRGGLLTGCTRDYLGR
jgi:hypothetical protein